MEVDNKVIDYDNIKFSKREWMRYSLEVLCLWGLISYLFYRSLIAMIFIVPVGYFYMKEKQKELAKKRKQRLNEAFKDGIVAVLAALRVGYSVENAFLEAVRDLKMNYCEDSDIVREFQTICYKLQNNIPIERLLSDFARRSHVEEIMDFAEVFAIAKRNGGDINKIIQNTVSIISDKIEVKQEIETMIVGKQTEQKIMNMVPIFIIAYVSVTSPHFFDVLYHNLFGVCVMSVCLLVYGVAIKLSKKIVEIEV